MDFVWTSHDLEALVLVMILIRIAISLHINDYIKEMDNFVVNIVEKNLLKISGSCVEQLKVVKEVYGV